VLIADVHLPGSSGVEMGVRLRALEPRLKILVVSGNAPHEWSKRDAMLFKELPADSLGFLRKPYSGHELITKLIELSGSPPAAASDISSGKMQSDFRPTATLYDAVTRQAGLLDLAHDAIIVHNLAGDIRYWNHGAETLYGWLKDEIAGKRPHILLGTVFPDSFENIKRALLDTRRWEGELHQTVRDGSPVIVSSRWAVRDAEDNEIEILEINRDISSQKRTEAGFLAINRELQMRVEELHRAEQMFRSLLESAPDSMVIVNGTGEIVIVNAQAEKMFGYTRDELLGNNLDILLPERFRTTHPEYRAEYVRNPHVRPMDECNQLFGLRKSGEEFPVEISLSPIQTGAGWLYCSAIRDSSERKRFERRSGGI
jgi:PAS domain S-box-containing protein